MTPVPLSVKGLAVVITWPPRSSAPPLAIDTVSLAEPRAVALPSWRMPLVTLVVPPLRPVLTPDRLSVAPPVTFRPLVPAMAELIAALEFTVIVGVELPPSVIVLPPMV